MSSLGIYVLVLILSIVMVQSRLGPNKNEACLLGKNPCQQYDKNCSGCVAAPDCQYCNDFEQCVYIDHIKNCTCDKWLLSSKHCMEGVCAEKLGCEECSNRTYCVWCEAEKLCLSGGFFGPGEENIAFNVSCSDWRWFRCVGMTGALFLMIFGSAVVLLFTIVIVGCVLFKSRKELVDRRDRQSINSHIVNRSLIPKTDKRNSMFE